jgi:hypothetical protein
MRCGKMDNFYEAVGLGKEIKDFLIKIEKDINMKK